MKRETYAGMFLDQSEKGIVGILVTFLKNVLEISGGLVSMNDEDKVEGRTGGSR